MSFRGNSISVLENQTEVNVCLELRNVSVPTLAEIWVDIVSNDLVATATGKIHTSQYQTACCRESLVLDGSWKFTFINILLHEWFI